MQPEPNLEDVPLVHVERGGDITYHGPGQLVGYPIIMLEKWPEGVVPYLGRLSRLLASAVAHFGIVADDVGPQTGLWVADPGGRPIRTRSPLVIR